MSKKDRDGQGFFWLFIVIAVGLGLLIVGVKNGMTR